jgi:hypothetical protein
MKTEKEDRGNEESENDWWNGIKVSDFKITMKETDSINAVYNII